MEIKEEWPIEAKTEQSLGLVHYDTARAQLQRIKDHWQAFWFELKDFHERKAWIPLGYTSFKACVEEELGMSERRAYQFLDAASIRAELDTEQVFSIDSATEGQLRELKPLEPEQRLDVARQIDFAKTSVREVREIVQQTKGEFAAELYNRDEEQRAALNKPPAHVSYNSGNNEWYTPPEYIKAAWRVMGRIDLDPASSLIANATVKAVNYFAAEDDGLVQHWAGRVWMNPPYAADLIGQFTDKLGRHFAAGDIPEALVLVNNATETNWFQSLLIHASAVCFIKQRVRFIDVNGNPSGAPLQGQAVLYLGDNAKVFAEEFGRFGTVLYGRIPAGRN